MPTRSPPPIATELKVSNVTLIIDSVAKRFDNKFAALKGASLEAPKGAFVALLGPSGSGKTTLLRILGGLEFADTGRITYENEDWLAKPARERRAGFVFQQYALFRHMTVEKNVASVSKSGRASSAPAAPRSPAA